MYILNVDDVRIPADKVEHARKSLVAAKNNEKLKHVVDSKLDDNSPIDELILSGGWDTHEDTNGDVVFDEFVHEKYYRDHIFFYILAPFIKDGASIEFELDCYEFFRWEFRQGELWCIDGRIAFDGEPYKEKIDDDEPRW